MKAAFFYQNDEDLSLDFIAYAKTNNPRKEFKLLVRGESDDDYLFKAYGNKNPPELDQDSALGVGRNVAEAERNIILTGQEVEV